MANPNDVTLNWKVDDLYKAFTKLSKAGIAGAKAGAKAGEELKDLFPLKKPEWLISTLKALCDDDEHVERCLTSFGWFIDPGDLSSIIEHVKRNKHEERIPILRGHSAWLDKEDIA